MTSAQISTQTSDQPEPPSITLPVHLRRIVLTGFMGSGKSTIGRLLAQQLGWEFLDLDAHIESRTGSTVPELFAQHGEAHFRQLESSALASALGRSSTVLALGGGTPESLTNRLLLEQTPGTLTIFLDATFETLFDRCVLQGPGDPVIARPVLADPDQARARFISRQPSYRRLARLTLDTETLSPDETTAMLLLSLEKVTLPSR
ncbi:shikimate kinase [Granulicella arctica]|uniref:Shikimate kinase n=1 Tax=Granulicella arctica TaxID=940613 RepID=A0A7Y9PH14_9BACT|nr:shikimate kinase [Granulicella arctica]NYF79744.1 shikimate kinase [Granulicella arctica]